MPTKLRRTVRGPRFDGARETDRFIRVHGLTVAAFCGRAGLNRLHLESQLRGGVKRSPDADFMLAVQAATNGRVVVEMWRKATLRWDTPEDVVVDGPSAPTSAAAE